MSAICKPKKMFSFPYIQLPIEVKLFVCLACSLAKYFIV